MNRGSVTIDGVKITWFDTRRMVDSEPDDLELEGEFQVSITASDASPAAVAVAANSAALLQEVAGLGDLIWPHSDSMLRPVGLDADGSVVLQIFRGDRKLGAESVSTLRHMVSKDYADDPVAEKSIEWIRAMAEAIDEYRLGKIPSLRARIRVISYVQTTR